MTLVEWAGEIRALSTFIVGIAVATKLKPKLRLPINPSEPRLDFAAVMLVMGYIAHRIFGMYSLAIGHYVAAASMASSWYVFLFRQWRIRVNEAERTKMTEETSRSVS